MCPPHPLWFTFVGHPPKRRSAKALKRPECNELPEPTRPSGQASATHQHCLVEDRESAPTHRVPEAAEANQAHDQDEGKRTERAVRPPTMAIMLQVWMWTDASTLPGRP